MSKRKSSPSDYRVLRSRVISGYGGKCSRCGFTDWRALCVDHTKGKAPHTERGAGRTRMLKDIIRRRFPDDHQVLCANCNLIKALDDGEILHKIPYLDSRVGGKPGDTQEKGAGKIEYRYDLVDPVAISTIAAIMHDGARDHSPDGWRKLPVSEHINHALAHVFFYMAGSKTEDHLGRALTRLHMAVGVERGRK